MKTVMRIGKGRIKKRKKTQKVVLDKGIEKVSVKIDHKTVILVPKGTDLKKAKEDFIKRLDDDQARPGHM